MRRYPICGVEHVHMMRRVPRSYDMTRTHIIHKSVNRHVDVVLRCSPKHWKRKKVRVRIIENVKKNNCIKIRANAKKGYVAVRKVTNEAYERDRKNISSFNGVKVVRYAKASVADKSLIHDMKSQISIMAKKSADYIHKQLTVKPSEKVTVPPVSQSVQTAVPQSVKNSVDMPKEREPFLSNETERILQKGGYKKPKSISANNPYASDYSKQVSNAEFRSLMESLEKSLDEACSKYGISSEDTPSVPQNKSSSEFVKSNVSGYPQSEDFSLSVTSTQNTASQPQSTEIKPAPDSRKETEEFKPVSVFPKEDDEFKPVPVFPKDEEEAFKPVSVFQKDEEEEFRPIPTFPKDDEEAFKPVSVFPKDEEEELRPIPTFPKDEDEEEFRPIPTFPKDDEEEQFIPIPAFPKDDEGYSPAPVSPDRNERPFDHAEVSIQPDPEDYDTYDERPAETFLSRTGGQIKKVIGIIRGSATNLFSHRNDDDYYDDDYGNDDVEITYSDRDNRY